MDLVKGSLPMVRFCELATRIFDKIHYIVLRLYGLGMPAIFLEVYVMDLVKDPELPLTVASSGNQNLI